MEDLKKVGYGIIAWETSFYLALMRMLARKRDDTEDRFKLEVVTWGTVLRNYLDTTIDLIFKDKRRKLVEHNSNEKGFSDLQLRPARSTESCRRPHPN